MYMDYYENCDKLVEEIHRINIKLSFIKDKTSTEYHQLKRKVKQLRKQLHELRNE